jgi:YegS/Rv2252/BmrU family lipid kinase
MTERPVRIIVNPISGSGYDRGFISALERHLSLRGFRAEVTATEGPGHARELARSAPEETRCVVSVGGDGTHREVMSGLIGRPVPVCIVPSGTENVLGRTFGARGTLADVVTRVQDGQTVALDIGVANGHPFIMFSGIGFDAAVTQMVHENRRGNINRDAYLGPILRLLWRYRFPRLAVSVDGRRVADDVGYLLVANTPQYAAHLHIAPMAKADDGLLDVVCYRVRSRWQLLAMAVETLRGRHLGHPLVMHKRGRSIEVASAEGTQPVQIDGDTITSTPVTYTVMPKVVNFLLAPRVAG